MSVSEWLYRINRWWITLLASIVFILFVIIVLPAHMGNLKSDRADKKLFSPDLSLWYSKTRIYNFANALGNEGRKAYIQEHFTFDLAWPIVYLLFLTTLITWLNGFQTNLRKFNKLLRRGNIIPLFAFGFDILENTLSSLVVYYFPKKLPVIASIAPTATLLKWMFVAVSILLIIYLIFQILILRIVFLTSKK